MPQDKATKGLIKVDGEAGRPYKVTAQQVEDALKAGRGHVTAAADILGVRYETVKRCIRRNPELEKTIDYFKTRRLERAAFKLEEAVERGEAWAIMFTLKNQGWNDREPVTSVTIGHLTIDFNDPTVPLEILQLIARGASARTIAETYQRLLPSKEVLDADSVDISEEVLEDA